MWNDEEDWVATAKAEGWLSPEQVQLLADALVDATLRVPSEASIVNLMESFTGSDTFLNPKDSVDLDRIERSLEVSQQFGRYQDKLRTLRAAIAGGLELQLLDDTFPGNKTTYATWGLCTNSPEVYGSKNDHIFPEAFEKRHRITERSPPEGASCPLDRGTVKDEYKLGSSGCFFRCRLFKPLPRNAVESRESALKRYDLLIEKREAQFGRKTTADDNEQGW